jgi:hypothetical protein
MPGIHAPPVNAFAGQASTQSIQRPQKFLSVGGSHGSSISVNTVPNRIQDPNGRVMSWQLRPIHPKPALVAAVLWGKSPLIFTMSVRSEAPSGLDRKLLAMISFANATDNSLIRWFTLEYSSAYAWFGPFRMLAIIRGFIGITHETAKGNLFPVSSCGVGKS